MMFLFYVITSLTHLPSTYTNGLPISHASAVHSSHQLSDSELSKLARAISQQETGGCIKGVAKYRNCFGIRQGNRWKHYGLEEESYQDFYRIWKTKYGNTYPTLNMAKKWCGCEGTHWLKNVTYIYEKEERADEESRRILR